MFKTNDHKSLVPMHFNCHFLCRAKPHEHFPQILTDVKKKVVAFSPEMAYTIFLNDMFNSFILNNCPSEKNRQGGAISSFSEFINSNDFSFDLNNFDYFHGQLYTIKPKTTDLIWYEIGIKPDTPNVSSN